MQGINEALKEVGECSIKELFDYIITMQNMTDIESDLLDWVVTTRTAVEVGYAIYHFAKAKEKINAKDQGT